MFKSCPRHGETLYGKYGTCPKCEALAREIQGLNKPGDIAHYACRHCGARFTDYTATLDHVHDKCITKIKNELAACKKTLADLTVAYIELQTQIEMSE